MFVYKALNSKRVQDIDKYANRMTRKGWELVQVLAADNRYVSLFRKSTTEATVERDIAAA
jgi:hypothetical protein